jgi:hypothetical protein
MAREIYQVHPFEVRPLLRRHGKRDVQYQMERLEREGQIEPVCVKPPVMHQYELDVDHPDYWYWSPELVEAAVRLGWETILVTY